MHQVGVYNPLIMFMSSSSMKSNKVFQLELCPEDAQRIIQGLELLRVQCHKQLEVCNTDEQKNVAWLEWSYVSELAYMLEDKFEFNCW